MQRARVVCLVFSCISEAIQKTLQPICFEVSIQFAFIPLHPSTPRQGILLRVVGQVCVMF